MEPNKILIIHYGIGDRDGVNAILYRNITGLKRLAPDIKITLAGKISDNLSEFTDSYEEEFDYIDIPEFTPEHWEKPMSECDAQEYMAMGRQLLKILMETCISFDLIFVENLQVGIFPPMVYAFHEYVKWCHELEPEKRFIFRAHDFFWHRPENFENVAKFNNTMTPAIPDWHEVFFPNIPNVSYLAINIQSMNSMYKQGIPEEQLYFFPNCLDDTIREPDQRSSEFRELLEKEWELEPDEHILFSPIRCVPRKNVEESIFLLQLLNRLADPDLDIPDNLRHEMKFHLILSMNVETGKAATYSTAITDFINQKKLPVHIGFRGRINLEREYNDDGSIKTFSLSDAYAVSRAVLTTSTLEGFGFVFLEPWCTGSCLIGRDLVDVTYDFKLEGDIEFPYLYTKLTVEGTDFPAIGAPRSYIVKGGNILNEDQMLAKFRIIDQLADNKFTETVAYENRKKLARLVNALKNCEGNNELILHNQRNVAKYYSQEAAAQKLLHIITSIK